MYKNIIFDVGNVLLSYDWRGAMAKAGIDEDDINMFGEGVLNCRVWPEFDLGIRPYFEIVEDMCKLFPNCADGMRKFLTNVENMPLPRPKVWEKVHLLKEKGYKLYILSNYSKYMFDAHAMTCPFVDDMDGMMVSYMIHVNKPDKGIYDALLEKYNLDAKESLFFDDKEENVKAAIKYGIDAVTITSEEFLLNELDKLLV